MRNEVVMSGGVYSYRKHGHWVRLKGSNRDGRISYYEKITGKVHVLWESKTYQIVGQSITVSHPISSEHDPQELVYTPYEPDPWIDVDEVQREYDRRDGAWRRFDP